MPNLRPVTVHSPAPTYRPPARRPSPPVQESAPQRPPPQQQAPVRRAPPPQSRPETDVSAAIGTRVDARA